MSTSSTSTQRCWTRVAGEYDRRCTTTVGRLRIGANVPGPQIAFSLGNAEGLEHIPSDSIDLYTIAFGIRNCTHIDRVLQEAHRVLRPGGVFACLEFAKVSNPLLRAAYQAYSFSVIPNLGHILAGDRDSYQYLVESIDRFPTQQDFAQMVRAAGLRADEPWTDLTNGIAAIWRGVKPVR